MEVSFTTTKPFSGWPSVRGTLATLVPERVIRLLLDRVYEEMQQEDGSFHGSALHNYGNHGPVVRAALAVMRHQNMMLSPSSPPLTQAEETTLASLLAEYNGLARAVHVASRPADYDNVVRFSPAHINRVVTILWIESLRNRGRANNFRHELARAWLMLRKYWSERRDEVKGAVSLSLRDPLDTIFDSLECAIALTIAVYHYHGIIVDVQKAFINTAFAPHLASVLAWYTEDAYQAIGSWPEIEAFARVGLDSTFQEVSMVRLGPSSVLAPDLGIAFSGIADRLITRSISNYEANGEHALEAARTVLGLVFERHVQVLVEHCCKLSTSARYEPEFKLADRTDSPDAFSVSQVVTAFEAKATRFPAPPEQHGDAASLFQWLRDISGERPPRRQPLEQGSRFMSKWRAGDAEAVRRLGAAPAAQKVWYVIVTYEDVPLFVNWELFRTTCWRPLLGPDEQVLDARTIFISVRDLEALLGTLQWLHDVGTPSCISTLLSDWHMVWSSDQDIGIRGSRQLKPTLKSYLITRYPRSAGVSHELLQSAFEECWQAAEAALFAEE